ncbi:MAG: class II aldolase/adducin family protein [Candidatus Omnitrophica bacterium]|nr:class II aldolase/adducin family protein [Candidatus Omnitrophota bacterium]
MKNASERRSKHAIISVGRGLADARLIAARAGNISCRLSDRTILITATGARLGKLRESDIVSVDLATHAVTPEGGRPSSELAVHSLIYRSFPCAVIVHCHPPLSNAYFSVCPKLATLTYETHFYLGEVPVVGQKSLTVTKPGSVIKALVLNKIVVIRHHGVFSIGNTFDEALSRIHILEEAVKVAAVARLFKKRRLDALDKAIKKNLGSCSSWVGGC